MHLVNIRAQLLEKLRMLLHVLNETLKFQTYFTQKMLPFFCQKGVKFSNMLHTKMLSVFATINFVSTVRLSKSWTNNFIKVTMP